MGFNKRTYKNIGDFWADLLFPIKNRHKLREIRQKRLVSSAFRERLMLAVTAVNQCRYCSYFHARQALKSGVPQQDISNLLAGEIDACPPEEAPALAYAQHWAESDSKPDPEAADRLRAIYGEDKAVAINVLLRMIRLGNLTGNFFDYLLYKVSFGRRGN